MTGFPVATQRRLEAHKALRAKVERQVSLPAFDWSGLSVMKISLIVDSLHKLGDAIGHESETAPFVERFEDCPEVTWETPNGMILTAIEAWVREQCREAYATLEAMKPAAEDERDERMVVLLQHYGRNAEFDRAIALLTGANEAAPKVDHELIAWIDDMGEAWDRLLALSRMADGLADRDESSAFGRIIGDVQGLVTSVLEKLNSRHQQKQGEQCSTSR